MMIGYSSTIVEDYQNVFNNFFFLVLEVECEWLCLWMKVWLDYDLFRLFCAENWVKWKWFTTKRFRIKETVKMGFFFRTMNFVFEVKKSDRWWKIMDEWVNKRNAI